MNTDISIVIPYYESEKTITRALVSIKDQVIAAKEIIIVNDGSDIALLKERIKPFEDDLNLILIDLVQNFGAAHARNIGISKATGTYIAFLDADDVWHPEKLKIQYDFMRDSGAYLTCHHYAFNLNVKPMQQSNGSLKVRRLSKTLYALKTQTFTPTVMVLNQNFVRFDTRLSRSEDLKCWISNLDNGAAFLLKSELAGGYKSPVGESGLSGSYQLMHNEYLHAWRLLLNEQKVNLIQYLIAVAIEHLKYPLRILRINKAKIVKPIQ